MPRENLTMRKTLKRCKQRLSEGWAFLFIMEPVFWKKLMRCDCFLEIMDRNNRRIGWSEHFLQLFQGSRVQGETQKIPFFQGERKTEQEMAGAPVPKSLAL